MAEEKKSSFLILGGVGFIGRNLVKYLRDNELATKIRVVDKLRWELAAFNAEHKDAFEDKKLVEIVQGDLSRSDHAAKAFADFEPDYVINLCGETRCGLTEADYKKKTLESAVETSKLAATKEIKKWVEVSTAQVYQSNSAAAKEDSKVEPWTLLAKYRLLAEDEVKKHAETLPYVILRPAGVYGPGDMTTLTPRITCASVYQKNGKSMKFLWGKDLKINTVHVDDLSAAIVVACKEAASGSVYNVADSSAFTQGKFADLIQVAFKPLKTSIVGSMLSRVAKTQLSSLTAQANGEHVPAFQRLCLEHKISNTPISPFIDIEMLKNNHLSVDGNAIVEATSFQYKHPVVTQELFNAQIQSFIDQGIFPPVLVSE